jgi:hypothetical protein
MALPIPPTRVRQTPNVDFLKGVSAWVAPRHCRGVVHKRGFAQTAAESGSPVAHVWKL